MLVDCSISLVHRPNTPDTHALMNTTIHARDYIQTNSLNLCNPASVQSTWLSTLSTRLVRESNVFLNIRRTDRRPIDLNTLFEIPNAQ
jgi:hypothetical protein